MVHVRGRQMFRLAIIVAGLTLSCSVLAAAAAPQLIIEPATPLTAAAPEALHASGTWPIALTFDDGPSPRFTAKILDILDRQGVRATFFVVGQNAQANPDLLRRMVRSGDEIGNHTWNHGWMTKLSPDRQNQEIEKTTAAIETVVPGYTVTLFRAPYGAADEEVRQRVWNHGLSMVWWSVDDEDYRGFSPAKLHHTVLGEASVGGVILMHDIHANTVEALEGEIISLKARGARFVTIPQLEIEGTLVRSWIPKYRPYLIDREPVTGQPSPPCCSSSAPAQVTIR